MSSQSRKGIDHGPAACSVFIKHTETSMISPVDVVRRFYAALGRGDVPAVISLLNPQIEWAEAERAP